MKWHAWLFLKVPSYLSFSWYNFKLNIFYITPKIRQNTAKRLFITENSGKDRMFLFGYKATVTIGLPIIT